MRKWARWSVKNTATRSAAYIDLGEQEGASLVVDGRGLSVAGHEQGYFLGGTLFDQVTP